MNTLKEDWEKGIQDELHFWRLWLPSHYTVFSQPRKLREHFGEMIGDKKEVSILDIGSGPVSTIGHTWDNVKVNIIFSDILANEYKQIFKELNINQVQEVEYQDMQNLSYQDNTFDIISCRNALDHSINPIKAINEMIRVCKPGGWIYLDHFTRVAKKSRYHGFHQWNIDEKGDDDCLIWNRNQKFVFSEYFPEFVTRPIRREDGLSIGMISKYHKKENEHT